jgi:hypothetical protein
MEFRNETLEEVVKLAKKKGYKVYTFESSNNKYINQIFIEHTDGRIGSCSEFFSGVKFTTMHKTKYRSGLGTGFGQLIREQEFNNPEDLDICFITYPYWYHEKQQVEKYKSFEEYKQQNTILKYYEL